MRARLALLVVLLSASAGAVDFTGRARAAMSTGVDTNAPRDFVSPDGGSAPTDIMLQGVANLSGVVQGEHASFSAAYDVGARKFIFLPHEDTIVQSLQLDGTVWAGGGFAFGLTGRARDRRGADRSYSDLAAELNIQYLPDAALDFRVWGSIHRFIFWSGLRSSFSAPEGGLSARYRFNRRHSVSITGNVSFRTFGPNAAVKPVMPEPDPTNDGDKDGVPNALDLCPTDQGPEDGNGCPAIRRDFFALAGIAYWYRGPIILSLSYGYLDSSSNSFGESLRQHRVGLVFGAPLFWKLMLLIDINLRFAQYPDGLYVSPEILTLDEGGENLTSGVVKLVRPFGEHFEVEARYGIWYGVLPTNHFTYWRHAVSLGVGVHF